MMAATDFIRVLVGWRPSSIGGPIAPGQDELPEESGVPEPNQIASSTLGAPSVSRAPNPLVRRRVPGVSRPAAS
jgi:hypothetical protein